MSFVTKERDEPQITQISADFDWRGRSVRIIFGSPIMSETGQHLEGSDFARTEPTRNVERALDEILKKSAARGSADRFDEIIDSVVTPGDQELPESSESLSTCPKCGALLRKGSSHCEICQPVISRRRGNRSSSTMTLGKLSIRLGIWGALLPILSVAGFICGVVGLATASHEKERKDCVSGIVWSLVIGIVATFLWQAVLFGMLRN
jgi:hypothetical protein